MASVLNQHKVQVVMILYAATALLSLAGVGASFLTPRGALLAWALIGISGLAAAAWLMGIEMGGKKA